MVRFPSIKIKNQVIFFSGSLIFLLQYLLFYAHIKNQISGFYPENYDQASYLPFVYSLYEQLKKEGVSTLLNSANILPTGILFPVNALVLFLLFKASRFYALLPNFVYFILLQITLFFTAKKIFGSNAFGFILIGCLLAVNSPFYIGGLADYRMDFIAFCLYGIVSCFLLWSKVFLDKKWTFISVIAVVLIILMRFITAIYYIAIFSFLMIFLISQVYYSKSPSEKIEAKIRIKNFYMSMLLITLLLTPFIILTYHGLYQYYIVSHLGEVRFRAYPEGVNGFAILKFYPTILKDIHLGPDGILAIKLLLIISAVCYLITRKNFLSSFSIFKYETIFFNTHHTLSDWGAYFRSIYF